MKIWEDNGPYFEGKTTDLTHYSETLGIYGISSLHPIHIFQSRDPRADLEGKSVDLDGGKGWKISL